jgi:uncharacterized protein (TIGR04222 family)
MSMRSRARAAVAVVGIAFALVVAPGGAARAQSLEGIEHIQHYGVVLDIDPNGTLHVTEVIDYDFGSNSRHGIYRNIPVRFHYDQKYDRIYPISHVKVTASSGTPTNVKLSDANNQKVIRIGSPNRTITGQHQYTIAYDVAGALNHFSDHEELDWNAVGLEWAYPIVSADAVVRTPVPMTQIACQSGPAHSTLACAGATGTETTEAHFHADELSSHEGLTVVAAVPVGSVTGIGPKLDERWAFQRAFAITPGTGGGAAAVALLVGLLVDRRLLDDSGAESRVPMFGHDDAPVEYRPPDELRPAQVGVLVDERADPLDVTASIVDLAVRGYLKIEELPHHGIFSKGDWKLTNLKSDNGDLQPYEARLHDALFATGDEVELSKLKNHFYDDLKKIENDLYVDCVQQGWFAHRPDTTRGAWFAIGIVASLVGLGVLALVAAFSHAGLVAVPLAISGLVILAAHNRMPARTGKGTAELQRVLGFKRFITTAETERMQFAEEEGIFAKYLPFAIVFGATKQWAKRFEGLDASSPAMGGMGWYISPYPFNPIGFSDRMSDFTTHTAGTIVSTPPSTGGSSGFGGFSGGGGGGGGGGSW